MLPDVLSRVFLTAVGPTHVAATCISSDESTTYRLALIYVNKGSGDELEGFCSCPFWRNACRVGQRCKHLDALAVAWKQELSENVH